MQKQTKQINCKKNIENIVKLVHVKISINGVCFAKKLKRGIEMYNVNSTIQFNVSTSLPKIPVKVCFVTFQKQILREFTETGQGIVTLKNIFKYM